MREMHSQQQHTVNRQQREKAPAQKWKSMESVD